MHASNSVGNVLGSLVGGSQTTGSANLTPANLQRRCLLCSVCLFRLGRCCTTTSKSPTLICSSSRGASCVSERWHASFCHGLALLSRLLSRLQVSKKVPCPTLAATSWAFRLFVPLRTSATLTRTTPIRFEKPLVTEPSRRGSHGRARALPQQRLSPSHSDGAHMKNT